MTSLHILHINSYYATSGLFDQLYTRQMEHGHHLDVYVPLSYTYPEEKLAVRGDYALVSRNHHQLSRWIFPWKHRTILKDLEQSYNFHEHRPQIIHAHSLFSNGWLALQLHKRYHIPYVVAVRNADLRTFFERMPWMRRTGLAILKQAAQIIFISNDTRQEVFTKYIPEEMRDSLYDKSIVIPNGIDDFWHQHRFGDLSTERQETNKSWQQPIRLVVTSKIIKTKRLTEMAKLIASYNQRVQPVELYIIGPAWDEAELERLQQFSFVTYLGPKTKEELVPIYRQMDAFTMLSYPETFGLVYVEAMSQGLPVIYTQGEGFDNFFPNHHIGVSVEANNQVMFDNAMDYIFNPAHYNDLCHQAVQASAQFNWDEITEQYDQVYCQVMEGVYDEES